MSKGAPKWILLKPKACEKCGKAYSSDAFEYREIDTDIAILDREHRTWCKECDSQYLDETEET